MAREHAVTACVFETVHRNEIVGSKNMRGPLGSYLQDTVGFCFNVALDQLGPIVREAITDLLGKIGIAGREIGPRFSEVAKVLTENLGNVGRIIVYNTLVEVCEEYSFTVDFSPTDSLGEKFVFLENRVLADHLTPRRVQRGLLGDQYLAPIYASIFDSFSINPQRVSG